jgi:hypothetical protein
VPPTLALTEAGLPLLQVPLKMESEVTTGLLPSIQAKKYSHTMMSQRASFRILGHNPLKNRKSVQRVLSSMF